MRGTTCPVCKKDSFWYWNHRRWCNTCDFRITQDQEPFKDKIERYKKNFFDKILRGIERNLATRLYYKQRRIINRLENK